MRSHWPFGLELRHQGDGDFSDLCCYCFAFCCIRMNAASATDQSQNLHRGSLKETRASLTFGELYRIEKDGGGGVDAGRGGRRSPLLIKGEATAYCVISAEAVRRGI